MLSRGWSEDDVKQVVGLNMIRVIQQVEQVGIQIQRKMFTPTRLYTCRITNKQLNTSVTDTLCRERSVRAGGHGGDQRRNDS